MLATARDLFRSRRRGGRDVAPGTVFRHSTAASAVETAEVLDISHDERGIAHVRFRMHIARGDTTFVDEVRVLALESFRDRFRDVAAT